MPMLRLRMSPKPSLAIRQHSPSASARALQGDLSSGGGSIRRRQLQKNSSSIPKAFDARQQWPTCISIGTLRNQGNW